MGVFQKIKNFFSRFIVYQMVFIWLYMKLGNIDKSANDLKTRMMKTITHFNMKNEFISFLIDDPIALHLILSFSELIFIFMAIFGNRFGAWMIAMHFGFTTLLFFNPLLPENSFSFWKMDIRHDMLTSYGVLCSYFLLAYYPTEENEYHKIEGIENDEDEEDFVDSLSKPALETHAPHNKKKK